MPLNKETKANQTKHTHAHTYAYIYIYIYIDDGRLPRQLFYGEMGEGKRSALKPKKRFKDTIRYYLKQSGLSMDQWEKMASDRSKMRKLIHESIESYENSRMQYSAYKRLIRKGEQGPQCHHANGEICGKLCLSLASLKSHLRKCAKSLLNPNNITANKTDRLCQFCGKICCNLAVENVDYPFIAITPKPTLT